MSEKTITRDLFSDLNKKVTAWVGEKTKEGGTRCCDGRNRWEMSDSAKNATLVVNFKMCGVVRCVVVEEGGGGGEGGEWLGVHCGKKTSDFGVADHRDLSGGEGNFLRRWGRHPTRVAQSTNMRFCWRNVHLFLGRRALYLVDQ